MTLALNGTPTGDPREMGGSQALVVIGAAVSTGVGLLLLVMGILKRRRAAAGTADRESGDPAAR